MPQDHPDAETLELLVLGKLDPERRFEVAWHLFHCAHCRERLTDLTAESAELLHELFGSVDPLDSSRFAGYESAFDKALQGLLDRGRQIERERMAAPELLAEMLGLPPERRRLLIANSERHRSFGLAELLLARCREAWNDDPAQAEELATMALDIADLLDPELHGGAFVSDLRAQAWAYVGNARRIRSDLVRVDEAFQVADILLQRGSGDPLEAAHLLELKASLRRDQRRFAEAIALLDQAIRIYRSAGEEHRSGRALIKKATVFAQAGSPEESIPLLEEAARRVDPGRDARLPLCIQHNLATYLKDAGRPWEARGLLPKVRRLSRKLGNRLDLLRLTWLEGSIAESLDQVEEAKTAFEQARQGFLENGIVTDAALVCLDLAALYLKQGELEEAARLATSMLPIFESKQIHREALAALALVVESIERRESSVRLVQEIAALLRGSAHHRHRGDAGL